MIFLLCISVYLYIFSISKQDLRELTDLEITVFFSSSFKSFMTTRNQKVLSDMFWLHLTYSFMMGLLGDCRHVCVARILRNFCPVLYYIYVPMFFTFLPKGSSMGNLQHFMFHYTSYLIYIHTYVYVYTFTHTNIYISKVKICILV